MQEYITPEVNIFATKDGYVLEAEMPGVAKEGLEVTVEDRELTIVGRRNAPAPQGEPLFCECPTADYRRVFELDPAIDTGKINARIQQGIAHGDAAEIRSGQTAKNHRRLKSRRTAQTRGFARGHGILIRFITAQAEETLWKRHGVGIGRRCAGNIYVSANDIGGGLQREGAGPGKHQIGTPFVKGQWRAAQ